MRLPNARSSAARCARRNGLGSIAQCTPRGRSRRGMGAVHEGLEVSRRPLEVTQRHRMGQTRRPAPQTSWVRAFHRPPDHGLAGTFRRPVGRHGPASAVASHPPWPTCTRHRFPPGPTRTESDRQAVRSRDPAWCAGTFDTLGEWTTSPSGHIDAAPTVDSAGTDPRLSWAFRRASGVRRHSIAHTAHVRTAYRTLWWEHSDAYACHRAASMGPTMERL